MLRMMGRELGGGGWGMVKGEEEETIRVQEEENIRV